jgi:hypothetical protein
MDKQNQNIYSGESYKKEKQLISPNNITYVAVFWDVKPCGSCKNRRFGGKHRLLHQGEKFGELGTLAIRSSETLVLTTAARRHIPEDGILH